MSHTSHPATSAAPQHCGAILYASDDPQRVRDVATCLRAQGIACAITAGVDTYYAIRAVVQPLGFDRGYLRWRQEFGRWVREWFGGAP